MKTKTHTPQTVAELRAILDARKPYCLAINEAFRRGDMDGTAAAQKAMREVFPEG